MIEKNNTRTRSKKKVPKDYKKFAEGNVEKVIKRYRINTVESIIIIVSSLIFIILLCNKTFFHEEYKTKNVNMNIPLLYFFTGDDGKKIEFKTFRESKYDKTYFDNYLDTLDIYKCNNKVFYYDKERNTTIYSIEVEKSFAVNTIIVNYSGDSPEVLCEE